MPLTYFLYRCPRCGHDPMEGAADEAFCPQCGLHYSRGGDGGLIRIQDPSGEVWEVPAYLLTDALEAWDGAGESKSEAPGGPLHRAEVQVRQSGSEAPVRWGGELLGFAEAMGDASEGLLEISEEALTLRPLSEKSAGRAPVVALKSWHLMDIRAVQTSSSSLQFSPSAGGLVEFRFPHDSPFRWEQLLRNALKSAYRRRGIGEIVEFQPRVVTE